MVQIRTFYQVVQELEQGLRDGSIVLSREGEKKSTSVLYQVTLVEPKESEEPYSFRDEYTPNLPGIALVTSPAREFARQLANDLSGVKGYSGKIKITLEAVEE